MTAQPTEFHGARPRPPRIAMKVSEIRKYLAAEHREQFNQELDDAIETNDMAEVNKVKERWWGQALIDTDPGLKARLEAAERGEVEYFPSPFASR
jgi:Family of unknown function (DUF6247)